MMELAVDREDKIAFEENILNYENVTRLSTGRFVPPSIILLFVIPA
jgi:hypothetical protein